MCIWIYKMIRLAQILAAHRDCLAKFAWASAVAWMRSVSRSWGQVDRVGGFVIFEPGQVKWVQISSNFRI